MLFNFFLKLWIMWYMTIVMVVNHTFP